LDTLKYVGKHIYTKRKCYEYKYSIRHNHGADKMKEFIIARKGLFPERLFIESKEYMIDIFRKSPYVIVTKVGDWRANPRTWKKVSFEYSKGVPKSVPAYVKKVIAANVADMRKQKLVNW